MSNHQIVDFRFPIVNCAVSAVVQLAIVNRKSAIPIQARQLTTLKSYNLAQ